MTTVQRGIALAFLACNVVACGGRVPQKGAGTLGQEGASTGGAPDGGVGFDPDAHAPCDTPSRCHSWFGFAVNVWETIKGTRAATFSVGSRMLERYRALISRR